jgi:hypothetical protein
MRSSQSRSAGVLPRSAKFHPQAWRALTAKLSKREIGLSDPGTGAW